MEESNSLIICLGSGNHIDGSLSGNSIMNAKRAAELFLGRRARMILFSGGYSFKLRVRPKISEAEGMKLVAIDQGVPESSIIKEEESLDTTGNALFSSIMVSKMPWVKGILLVTNEFHLGRAEYLFRKAFCPRYEIVPVSSGIPINGTISKEEESKKLSDLKSIYDSVDCNGFKTKSLATHPLYGYDPKLIPQYIWNGFEKRGFTKDYRIHSRKPLSFR